MSEERRPVVILAILIGLLLVLYGAWHWTSRSSTDVPSQAGNRPGLRGSLPGGGGDPSQTPMGMMGKMGKGSGPPGLKGPQSLPGPTTGPPRPPSGKGSS
jgi:hypothetical protein